MQFSPTPAAADPLYFFGAASPLPLVVMQSPMATLQNRAGELVREAGEALREMEDELHLFVDEEDAAYLFKS